MSLWNCLNKTSSLCMPGWILQQEETQPGLTVGQRMEQQQGLLTRLPWTELYSSCRCPGMRRKGKRTLPLEVGLWCSRVIVHATTGIILIEKWWYKTKNKYISCCTSQLCNSWHGPLLFAESFSIVILAPAYCCGLDLGLFKLKVHPGRVDLKVIQQQHLSETIIKEIYRCSDGRSFFFSSLKHLVSTELPCGPTKSWLLNKHKIYKSSSPRFHFF